MTTFLNTLLNRRSTRAFLDQPVSETQLRELLMMAAHAPSAGNTQPWEIIVAQGKPLDEIKNKNEHLFLSGAPQRAEVSNRFNVTNVTEAWPPTLARRYQNRGRKILEAKGIERHDKAARHRFYCEMYRYFEAPVVLLLGFDKQLPEGYTMFDLGLFTQAFCLAAEASGLGTCIEAVGVFYPDVLRAHLPIPEHLHLALSVAVGYPDTSVPINRFERDTAPLNEWVHGLTLD